MKNPKALAKYLARYSSCFRDEHTNHFISLLEFLQHKTEQKSISRQKSHYQHGTVIPAFNESTEFIQRFAQLPTTQPQLLIVVTNCPTYASNEAKFATAEFIENCQRYWAKENVMEGVTFGQINSGIDLLLLDITEQRGWLDSLQSGVGFARKIGMDIAINLWQRGFIQSPWIYCSDADAFWPDNYFTFTDNESSSINEDSKGAAVFAFQHQHSADDTSLSTAAAIYDCSLRYYVLGLRWSNSPWAYHTIGSTLMIHSLSYVETRGFPVREAGEDFYLLNKIAKTGNIYNLDAPCLKLSDRTSERVPFGTGPAVNKIQQQSSSNDFLMYHPKLFELLKAWHALMPALFEHDLEVSNNNSELPEDEFHAMVQGLKSLGLEKALQHCRQQAKDPNQFRKHLWQWFDGFRTLKFIHWLRDNQYPSIGFNDWASLLEQQQIPFITQVKKSESARALSQQLQQLEFCQLPLVNGLQ